ncbi:MAG: protein kinase domain-containing protein [Acidobacteriota bacterium]
MIRETIGPYRVLERVGTGGRGEVSRAHDTTLGRDVALKVLPEAFAADPDRLARFEREARTLASLNHPHIAQIHGLEEDASAGAGQPAVRALVMELVEGEDLSDKIARGALAPDEALPIARQIADALAAAHEAGIIHRDLKPANVKVRADGTVKVLDFGLAKAGATGAAGATESLSSPTMASPAALTMGGMILGTAAYMAPEQARGRAVDGRVDIWAFGVILFEMLTGRPLFASDTVSDTLAAVLRQDIEWSRVPSSTPGGLVRLLRLCLERDPSKRLHHAADLRVLIDAVPSADGPQGATAPTRTDRRQALAIAAGAAAVALVAGALASRALWGNAGTAAPQPTVRFAIAPPPNVANITNIAIAPDGAFLVYAATTDATLGLYIHRFDTGESALLPGTAGARWPFISPTGTWVGFFRDGKIQKIAIAGGDALTVCDAPGGPGALWLADGRIVFSAGWLDPFSVVSEDGGTPSPFTALETTAGEKGHWWPTPGPDGQLLYTVFMAGGGLNDNRIAMLDPGTGRSRILFPGARAYWLASGHIVYYRAGRYQVVRFDPAAGRSAGEASLVFPDATDLDPGGDWPQQLVVSPMGLVAYVPGRLVADSSPSWILPNGELQPLPLPVRPYRAVALSPDGSMAALSVLERGQNVVRVANVDLATDALLDLEGGNWGGVWHPDGRRLAYTSMRKGDFDVYVTDVTTSDPDVAVLRSDVDEQPNEWATDGSLVYTRTSAAEGVDALVMHPERPDAAPTVLVRAVTEQSGSLSPDNRWLAFSRIRDGVQNTLVQPFPGSGPATQITRAGGRHPLFARHGSDLYFRRDDQLIAVNWRSESGRFIAGSERVVTDRLARVGSYNMPAFSGAPDGRILALLRTEPPPPPRINVVMGWTPPPTGPVGAGAAR